MKTTILAVAVIAAVASFGFPAAPTLANDYREKGKSFELSGSGVFVSPPRDWNRLSIRPGKFAETWTLDGEQLNDVTFYSGVEVGAPLVKERDKKRQPLPRFTAETLLVEVPELLEGTYRAYKQIGEFRSLGSRPGSYLGAPGVVFNYEFTDADGIRRSGEAHAAIIAKKLYMASFDAPRIHFYQKGVGDFRALLTTAKRQS
ncbi:hypothetical protein SAMN06297144_1178 [Sphingomonas guangdongensis]|uniref:Uncharacterized protein n=1 Tax=Sphingomonas guangdongensis TaxID=1141890 RepID=A0A285QFQ9_9SPHN|nr:hypothetical protein [Sphingomonas guangdongensis]SOB80666.1 hypothetical protein SAMN06297144_1178 [Sphingomonas guangdongensis]